jgi:hypothetical protein
MQLLLCLLKLIAGGVVIDLPGTVSFDESGHGKNETDAEDQLRDTIYRRAQIFGKENRECDVEDHPEYENGSFSGEQ